MSKIAVKLALITTVMWVYGISWALPQGTEFTYQGELVVSGVPADGEYDFRFHLYKQASDGFPISLIPTVVQDVLVKAGVFAVELNFGSLFNGDQLWLEIEVRDGPSTGAYTTLEPRQKLTSTPYAVRSLQTNGITVAPNGHVSIGTASPTAGLNLEGPGYPESFMIFNGVGATSDSGIRFNHDNVFRWHIFNRATADDSFRIANGAGFAVFELQQNGNIGIGTVAPLTRLHMKGAGFPESFMTLEGSGGDFDAGLNIRNDGVVKWQIFNRAPQDDSLFIQNEGSITVLKAEQGGNIGIGTAAPVTRIHLKGAGFPESFMTLEGSGGDFDAGFRLNNDGVTAWHLYNRASDSDEFRIVNASDIEVIVAKQDGNVGIGTTNPLGKLDVNGAIFQRGASLHADYVFEPGYELESIEEHSSFMWSQGHLPAVPRAIKDAQGREIVEVGSHRRGILEELEKAHIYIERLRSENVRLAEQLSRDTQRLARLEQLVGQLYHED